VTRRVEKCPPSKATLRPPEGLDDRMSFDVNPHTALSTSMNLMSRGRTSWIVIALETR